MQAPQPNFFQEGSAPKSEQKRYLILFNEGDQNGLISSKNL